MPRLTTNEVRAKLATIAPATPRDNVVALSPEHTERQWGTAAAPPPLTAAGGETVAHGESDALPSRGTRKGARPPAPLSGAARDRANMMLGYAIGMLMTMLGVMAAQPSEAGIITIVEGAAFGLLAIGLPLAAALAAERRPP